MLHGPLLLLIYHTVAPKRIGGDGCLADGTDEVNAGACGESGVAALADRLCIGDGVADADGNLAQMAIPGA